VRARRRYAPPGDTLRNLTYRDAGVDIDAGDRLVELIRPLAASTARPEVLDGVGGFAGVIHYPGDPNRLLAASTDGVGTKVLLAAETGRLSGVGHDLVAMCVNDLICVGARPLLFLDYYATGKLAPEKAAEVIASIASGCREAGCVLLGGETAEMPGVYPEGVYDLAGFAVGAMSRDELFDPKQIAPGDKVLGLASSGAHSNGYSLVRKVFPEAARDAALAEELLTPTRIYVRAFEALRAAGGLKALAHITGGGLPGNLPRVLPEGMSARLVKGSWRVPPIFTRLSRAGGVGEAEMLKTFNCGVGLCAILPGDGVAKAQAALSALGIEAPVIGEIFAAEGAPGVAFSGAPLFG
jgi:phosphoribosylformylglycinamidine cyclo-ligase